MNTLAATRTDVPVTIVHPGIKINVHYLSTFVRSNRDKEPWKSAFEKVRDDYLGRGSMAWQAKPRTQVICGSFSNPDCGCTDQTRDSQAAYAQALLWLVTGDQGHADAAIRIIDAWSAVFTEGFDGSNARLQASWAGANFTCAAEILAHCESGWSAQGIAACKTMLLGQFKPTIERLFHRDGWNLNTRPGNWRSTGIEALFYIAIFTDDAALFSRCISLWKDHTVASIYLETDGPFPLTLPNWLPPATEDQLREVWYGPRRFIEGMNVESCRDFAHTAYGLAATINVAETALLHGIDLYTDKDVQAQRRLIQAMEFHSRYENIKLMPDIATGYPGIKASAQWTFEIGYTHYAVRMGLELPETRAFVLRHRPTQGDFHYMWESLTHAYPRTGDSVVCRCGALPVRAVSVEK
ncbi:alginate lyase family protein [Pseudomonas sp. B21-023]|uniref:alginate lyase family protein n=1 Tax=unclassified Pseudomonas TaxID=196821 RepID=UPI00215E6029|nr:MULTISPECIES: alginate lyase family protein [unclassified Pseudomonas]UVL18009.1 alginate lyase family protein [Pseudomonas sp. B21-044]UVM15374.1 alginate lyase family protein [Pseudomonas sp. B21-023]